MSEAVRELTAFLAEYQGVRDKDSVCRAAVARFRLTADRSVYSCPEFAVRFSSSATPVFNNTVLSLSALQKYDERPVIVCVVTPNRNVCLLANSTFLKKISHSSELLREDNIRGSFNGSDIARAFEGIANEPANFERLFAIHAGIGFDGNLARLVEATNNISPSGVKLALDEAAMDVVLKAPTRARTFVESPDFARLKDDLDARVSRFTNEILVASMIDNVNVRGRVIEYLIAGSNEALRDQLVAALRSGGRRLPGFKTENTLGDYRRRFATFETATDIKTKILILSSNPKAYNIDKMLEFLCSEGSVFLFYFVGVDPGKVLATSLVSMFQESLLRSTVVLRHWCGRNSRGVTQFEGRTVNDLIARPDSTIDIEASVGFLNMIAAL